MIITKKVEQKWNSKNKVHFTSLGYSFTKMGDIFEIDVAHLTKGSHVEIEILCDYCLKNTLKKPYKSYVTQHKDAIINKDCCTDCMKFKVKESNMVVYGKENVFQVDEYKEKYKNTMLQRYGVEYVSQTDGYKEKFRETSLRNHGVSHPFQNEAIKEKAKNTTLERYGVESYRNTADYLEKTFATNQKKYGVDWAGQSNEVREKTKNTNIEKYGVANVFQSPEIKQKIKESNLENYGVEYYSQTEDFKIKFKKTSLENYGVEHPLQNEEIREKIYKTNIEKYGFKIPTMNPKIKRKAVETLYKNGTCPTSSQQFAIYELLKEKGYNVELNYPVSNVNLDVAIFIGEIKIDLEYDGTHWHQNAQKDRKRDEFLKQSGWKIFRIKSKREVPDIHLLEESITKLISTDRTFISITLKDAEVI